MAIVMIELALVGFREAVNLIERVAAQANAANERGLRRIAKIAHREAVKNAPISPTQQILTRMRKARVMRRLRAAGAHGAVLRMGTRRAWAISNRRSAAQRKPRSTSRPSPGGLERSISFRSNNETAEVYAAANSNAGRYAFRIHSEKGITWRNRGPGTRAKGTRADHLFIERAVYQNLDQFRSILEQEHAPR